MAHLPGSINGAHYSAPMAHLPGSRFADPVDGSSITADEITFMGQRLQGFTIVPPGGDSALTCIFPTNPEGIGGLLRWLLLGDSFAASTPGRPKVVGIDTESDPAGGVATLQLCCGDHVLVLHRGASPGGLFRNPAPELVAFLNHGGDNRIFVGAELSGDALSLAKSGPAMALRLHGGVDLTPLYGDLAIRINDTRDGPRISTVGLRDMVNFTICSQLNGAVPGCWVKDRAITLSDWSPPQLSLPQLKYAALDAWASARMGAHAFTSGRLSLASWRHVAFTLAGWEPRHISALAAQLNAAAALKAAQRKQHAVAVTGLSVAPARQSR